MIFYTLIYPKVKWLNAYKNRFLKYYVKTYNICDAFVVLCDGYRKEWENLFGLSSSNKIRVIPNSERILEYVQLKKKKQILYSGRMSHEDKRIDRLLKIWREISVQRHTIVCQSGMEDYVSVTIDCTESFSFDFWTKELTCEYGNRYFDDVSEAFRKVYGNITIINNSK